MDQADIAKFVAASLGATPFVQSLGGEVLEASKGFGRARLPYAPHLVGDPKTGVIHGGVITTMLDQTCALAVVSALNTFIPFATLDLRIDYMKPAEPYRDIFLEAECLKIGREVAFTRGIAYQTSRDAPIALSTGAFMLMRSQLGEPAKPES